MPENNFEKQVQQKMDELKLQPSEGVWAMVEERIQKKRKRRVLFILIPVCAGLVLLGYYSIQKFNGLQVNKPITEQQSINGNKVGVVLQKENVNETGTNKELKINNENEVTPALPKRSILENEKKNGKIFKFLAGKKSNFVTKDKINDHFQISESRDPLLVVSKNKIENKSGKINEQPSVNIGLKDTSSNLLVEAGNENNTVDSALSKKDETIQPLIEKTVDVPTDELMNTIIDSAIIKPVAIQKISSGRLAGSIHLQVGMGASHNRSFPSFSENKAADMTASPGSVTGPPASTNRTYQQKATPGLHIELGYLLKKKIAKKFNLLAGIQYHFASDNLQAGMRIDSLGYLQNNFSSRTAVDAFYRGNNARYTNRYHFIELPVQLQWQLNKNSRVPLYWYAGLVPGRLISTNGLLYDTANGGFYYQEKNSFNKMLLSASTGFSIKFNTGKKINWTVGPDIRFGLNSLRKPEGDRNKYLISGGLHLNISLPKK